MAPHPSPTPDVPDARSGHALEQPMAATAIAPLAVSGLLVTKAALLAVLVRYVPQVTDIEVLDDGERFLLLVAGAKDG